MAKWVCRDSPIPGFDAKYLVRLANHLAHVHLLDINQRRKCLQEAKLQPKIKFRVYQTNPDENNTNNSSQERGRVCEIVTTKTAQNTDNNQDQWEKEWNLKTQKQIDNHNCYRKGKGNSWLSLY